MKQVLPSSLQGIVKAYSGNGRAFGYPTANISTATDLDDGVYFGFADLGTIKQQPALIFIGTPTTVGDTERRVEAHVLDIADEDYYGENLILDIRKYHRPNQTFASVEKLVDIMKEDEKVGRSWFNTYHP